MKKSVVVSKIACPMKRRRFLAASIMAAAGAAAGRWGEAATTPKTRPFRAVLLGDCLFTQGLVRADAQLARLLPILRSANVTVANFEGTLADAGDWASPINPGGQEICGGLNVRGDDRVMGDLSWLGIDIVGTANNHAMDWGSQGLLATARKLTAAGMAHAGTGKDLAEAREPAFHVGSERRTALISCASTYWPGALASHGNTAIPGRPGLNPVRVTTNTTGPNTAPSVDQRDLLGILDGVRMAKRSADVVLVSCHTHEDDGDRSRPPAFLIELAHACIDAGADALFSHGPHVLRGMEVYNAKPIFYGLGSFIFRARETRPLPEEIFENCQMTERDSLKYFERASREWNDDAEFWESVIAEVEFHEDRVSGVNLIPVVLRHSDATTWGMPELADVERGGTILARMKRLSEPFGVVLEIGRSVAHVRI